MGTFKKPKSVKLFTALLCNHESLFPLVEGELKALFGSIDRSSAIYRWTFSSYYEKEMGPGLLRRFVSFDPLIDPGRLPEIKAMAQDVEAIYQWVEGEKRGRRVNIDPGYIEASKVVLASTKNASHRIYLRSGIFGEATLTFYDGLFQPCAYTYPDYRWQETLAFFSDLRILYLRQLKQSG
jgi:hypothetical protein